MIGETELAIEIEREDRDVDFLHDGAEERGGLEGAEPLVLQRAAEDVDLGHDITERLVAPRPVRANGEVALTQRRQQIRHRVQRSDDVVLDGEREAEPASDDEQREGPLDLRRRIGAEPEKVKRDQRRRQTREERVEQDLLVVAEAVLWRSHERKAISDQLSASEIRRPTCV
jgi:hypothetical protein